MEAMLATECNLLINAGSYIQNLYSDEFYGSCFYAASKQSLENFVDFYTSNSSLRAITLKFFDTFGEGDTRDKILNIFLNNKSEQSLLKLTPGNQELRLTHVSDIVDALIHTVGLVKKAQTPHEKYFVGSEPITLRQLSIFFEKEAGCKLNIEWGATDYRKNQPLTSFSGKQLPGWKPKLSIKQGLRRFLDGVS